MKLKELNTFEQKEFLTNYQKTKCLVFKGKDIELPNILKVIYICKLCSKVNEVKIYKQDILSLSHSINCICRGGKLQLKKIGDFVEQRKKMEKDILDLHFGGD